MEEVDLTAYLRAVLTSLGSGKKERLVDEKILFLAHPLHQYRADHAPPADNSYLSHSFLLPLAC